MLRPKLGAGTMAAVEIVYRYLAEPGGSRPMPADGAAAQRRLEAGNQAFASLLSALEAAGGDRRLEIPLDARDVGLLGDGAAPAQRPYAALLGCADARVPAELIFGEGPNDLFVVRVAGNVLGQEVLGSLRYAADHLPLRAAVVLGHSGCGAVAAAVDLFQRPAGLLALATDHALRGLLDRLALVVQVAARLLVTTYGEAVPQHPGWRAALIEVAVALNAASGAYMLQKDLGRGGGRVITALHGVYVVNSRLVEAADPAEGERPGLAPAPADEAGFIAAFGAFARSRRIAALLA
jgi:carbonic anhydrase